MVGKVSGPHWRLEVHFHYPATGWADMGKRRRGSTVMARLARPTADEAVRLAVVADAHLSTRADGTSTLGQWMQFHRSESLVSTAFSDINSQDVDHVISVGDLTKDGAPWDIRRFDALLSDLDAPFLAVPGNHDVPKRADDHEVISVSDFVERYTPGRLPFHERVCDIDVIGMNSAAPRTVDLSDTHDGTIDDDQIEWLEERLRAVENPLVVMHHNLADIPAQIDAYREAIAREMGVPSRMRDPQSLTRVLATGDVPLVLTGHHHTPMIGRNDSVIDLAAPAVCSFPQAYLILDIDQRGTTVRFVPIADLDTATEAHAGAEFSSKMEFRGMVAIGAIRLSQFPLVEEWVPDVDTR